jgi:hypothetical protein
LKHHRTNQLRKSGELRLPQKMIAETHFAGSGICLVNQTWPDHVGELLSTRGLKMWIIGHAIREEGWMWLIIYGRGRSVRASGSAIGGITTVKSFASEESALAFCKKCRKEGIWVSEPRELYRQKRG